MHQAIKRSSAMATRTNITHKSTRPDLAHEDAHDLMPPWLAATVPALFATEHEFDPVVYVKLFMPDAGWMWYITEYDSIGRRGFGFVCGQEDLVYISLDDLATVRGPMGMAIERELFWQPTPLSRVRRGEVR
jgi:Protein of unknown function (DUF2958)